MTKAQTITEIKIPEFLWRDSMRELPHDDPFRRMTINHDMYQIQKKVLAPKHHVRERIFATIPVNSLRSPIEGLTDAQWIGKQQREAYFKAKGIAVPEKSAERARLALNFAQRGPGYFTDVLAMLDLDNDCYGWESVCALATVFGTPINNEFFDPPLALSLWIILSERHQKASACEVGRLYANGEAGEVKLNEAIYWYERAIRQGNEQAPSMLADLYKKYDPRYGKPQHKQFNAYVNALERTCIHNPETAADTLAAGILFAEGRLVPEDQKKAQEFYLQTLALDPQHVFSGAAAMKILALRDFLGIHKLPSSYYSRNEFMEAYTGEHSYCPGMRNGTKECFNHLMNAEWAFQFATCENKDPYYYTKIIRYLESAESGEVPFSDIEAYIEQSDDNITSAFLHALWARSLLSKLENRATALQWNQLLLQASAKQYDLSLAGINASTLRMGPFYNHIDVKGLPVLGALTAPSESAAEAGKRLQTLGFYTPPPGAIRFINLEAEEDGDIRFQCEFSKTRPSMLMQEDFEVVLALIFGGKDPVYPSLSLEPGKSRIRDKFNALHIKEWNPAWLEYTDFGRTLYITDNLIGALGWHAEDFSIGDDATGMIKSKRGLAARILQDMRFSGGACAGYCSGRVMLRPEHVPITMGRWKPNDPLKKTFWRVSVGDTKIMVDGAFTAKDSFDGAEDRNYALNDLRYAYGRTGHKLTQHYNAIANLIPVFERNRQLMSLLYAVGALRDNPHFKPGKSLLERASENLKRMQARATPPAWPPSIICRTLPLT